MFMSLRRVDLENFSVFISHCKTQFFVYFASLRVCPLLYIMEMIKKMNISKSV